MHSSWIWLDEHFTDGASRGVGDDRHSWGVRVDGDGNVRAWGNGRSKTYGKKWKDEI